MQRFWIRIRVWWHIGTTLLIMAIGAVYWVHDVNGSVADIPSIKEVQETQKTTLAVLTSQMQETHDQVKEIWKAMRLDKR